MPEPDYPYIKITNAGASDVNTLYAYAGLSNLRPLYIAEIPTYIRIEWINRVWCITPTDWNNAYYKTWLDGDWSFELLQAGWALGYHPDTKDPKPILEASLGPALPKATTLLTEDKLAPAGITDPTPLFTWTYVPGDTGLPQNAYQIHVASSRLLLDAHMPDLWDSGIVESAEPQATYAGEQLSDLQMYFWAVRVRDTAEVWSQDWY